MFARRGLFWSLLSQTLPFIFVAQAGLALDFPQSPDPRLTPGTLCHNPDARRYPERIAYCNRDVTFSTKWEVIRIYNDTLGYHIDEQARAQFKIDHLIPLCAGGGNEISNLWPQHKSVYQQTDPLEPLICEKMKAGRLKQSEAIEWILRAKHDLSEVPKVLSELQSL